MGVLDCCHLLHIESKLVLMFYFSSPYLISAGIQCTTLDVCKCEHLIIMVLIMLRNLRYICEIKWWLD